MGLILPTINVDSGLTWEQGVNSNSTILDGHDHSPGNGVQISPSSINVNGSFSFNNNSAINLKALVLTPQSSFTSVNSVYSIDADLYYNDGNSNVVRLTSGGTVNATSSGISSGTASASFVSSVLVVNSASNTPANIQGGSLLLGNNLSGSKYLTLAPPSAMAANYSLILPSLPAVQSFMTLDSSGNMAAPWTVDSSTIVVSSNVVQVPASGITVTQLAANAVTQEKVAIRSTGTTVGTGGFAVSASSGIFSNATTTPQGVTNLSVTITTLGNPVVVGLAPDGSSNVASFTLRAASTTTLMRGTVTILRGNVPISNQNFEIQNSNAAQVLSIPPAAFNMLPDIVAAGTYNYTVNISLASISGPGTVLAEWCTLYAYEMK